MRLELRIADGDVRARPFEFRRPVQVALFVEACLQLDDAGDLLAALRSTDQRADERRVVADAIHRHLDRQRLRIVGRVADESLDALVETLIWMVDDDVAAGR